MPSYEHASIFVLLAPLIWYLVNSLLKEQPPIKGKPDPKKKVSHYPLWRP